jgi:hypothetical protein
MEKIISRCGIICSECAYREKVNCPTCHKTNGCPFWGECKLAKCSITKGLHDCSQCEQFPCELLKEFSYDPKQGDEGKRIKVLQELKNSRKLEKQNV